MSYIGKVKNGVVVLPPNVHLQEGQEVEIIPAPSSPEEHFLLHDGAEVRSSAALPDDLAANHDYYLHGVSKQAPRRGRWISGQQTPLELTEQEAVEYTETLRHFALETHDLPPDLALNHNHYLHGHPKQ